MIYEEFIAKSRYARYLDSKKRRENWSELFKDILDLLSITLRKITATSSPHISKKNFNKQFSTKKLCLLCVV